MNLEEKQSGATTLVFHVEERGDWDAGISPFHDVVTVSVQSGNLPGDGEEFFEALREFLGSWYDAKVRTDAEIQHEVEAERELDEYLAKTEADNEGMLQ